MEFYLNLKNLFVDDSAATAIEYSLIVGLVSIVAIGSISQVGIQVNEAFSKVASVLSVAVTSE